MDRDLADEIRQFRSPADNETRMFYEIVIAPSFTPEGLAHLKGKSKTLRILESQPRAPAGRSLRQISGAYCSPDFLAPLCLFGEQVTRKRCGMRMARRGCTGNKQRSGRKWPPKGQS